MSIGECWRSVRRAMAWLWRMPHSAGFGVQSPYAFQFVRGVVYEREVYYAYENLSAHRANAALTERDDQLLFRLANYVQPRLAVSIGNVNPVTMEYLQAGCRAARHVSLRSAEDLRVIGREEINFLLCDLLCLAGQPTEALLADISGQAADGAFFCFLNIDATSQTRRQWQRLRTLPGIRLTFDLYRIGLLCFERRLARQDYVVRRW